MNSSNGMLLILTIFSMCRISIAQSSPQDFLDGHNKARAEIGVDPLSWDDKVAEYAQKFADSRIKDCQMENSEGPYGENLAAGFGELKGTDAVKMWVDEKAKYDHEANKCINGECLHYTQVIWNSTRSLGCARVKCHNGGMFVICSYDPPGNFIGEKPY